MSDVTETEITHAELARLRARLDDLEDLVVGGATHTRDPHDDAVPAGELVYPTLEAWVAGRFAPMVERPVSTTIRWCPRWWAHPEAVSRLEGLWRSWEQLRLDPAVGVSNWYRDHFDHHLAVLLGPTGPFAGCSPDQGHTGVAALPVELGPPGWWDHVPATRTTPGTLAPTDREVGR